MRTAFCVQYGTRPNWIDELRAPNRDIFELCWNESPVDGAIHFPNSSWTQGRNLLAQTVRDDESKRNVRYDYLVLADDDISFESMSHGEAMNRFEQTIEKYKPVVASPNYCWHFANHKHLDRSAEVQGIYATDRLLQAIHHDAWPVLLPYWDEFDAESWWNSSHIQNRVAATTFAGAVVSVNKVMVRNERSSDYPRAGKCIAADNMLREMAVEGTIWHGHETIRSFLPQPLDLQSSYRKSRAELAKVWNLRHRYWRSRRELTASVAA